MDYLILLDFVAAITGLGLAILLWFRARLGSASRILSLSLVPASMLSAVLGMGPLLGWPAATIAFYSVSCMLLFAAGGYFASSALSSSDWGAYFGTRRRFFAVVAITPLALIGGLYGFQPFSTLTGENSDTLVALGRVGYGAAIYLLLISVATLAKVEQTLRGLEEHVRWGMKFLLLGLALAFGVLVYVASQILLYPPAYSFLSLQNLRIFPAILLCSSLLIFESWRRDSRRSQVSVSQSAVYGTITFIGVGGYLVVSSVIARWASQWRDLGIPVSPVIFLLSLAVLSSLVLATAFRHRTKAWIRRHLFSGRYDYRQFWIDATEQVRSIESPHVAAAALANLIQNALGSLDLSVWMRVQNSSTMRVIEVRGDISEHLPVEIKGLADRFADLIEPAAASSFANRWQDSSEDFLKTTQATILVPLISSRRLVGLVTVGADRSGRPFEHETREFLRVMAGHFANEFHKAELLSTLVEAREAEAFHTFSTFLLHDLKNFASTLSLVAKNGTRHHMNPDFRADAFQSIFEISEKMKQLCNNLRSFSPTFAANKVVADINGIVRKVAESFDFSLGKHLEMDLGSLPSIAVDEQEIAIVLRNLILNAHEASPESAAIILSTSAGPGSITISVADHGRGISKKFLENSLFQPFQTTKSDGLGIGLFQCRKIVEAHDGTIEVESSVGVGTVVRIVLRHSAPQGAGSGQPLLHLTEVAHLVSQLPS